MNNAKDIYLAVEQKLQKNSYIDLSTLPNANHNDSLEAHVQRLLQVDYPQASAEVKDRVFNEFFGNGPLDHPLADRSTTEILINAANDIWIEQSGQLLRNHDHFFSFVSYQNFLQRLMAEAQLQINLERPYVDGYWRQCRVHLIIPPLARRGPILSLRRHPETPWSFSKLSEMKWAPADALELLRKMVKEKMSFLIVGATGTGKTSVLNACLQELDRAERIVSIEDSAELHAPNTLSVQLLTRFDSQGVLKNIDQSELLRQALRMRPDRIIMGEVRGAEAKDLLMALSTGHRGGMATLHADNAKQALYRLEMLVQMGAPQWSLHAIRSLIHFGLHAVVSIEKIGGERKLQQISRIASLEEHGFSLETLWARTEPNPILLSAIS